MEANPVDDPKSIEIGEIPMNSQVIALSDPSIYPNGSPSTPMNPPTSMQAPPVPLPIVLTSTPLQHTVHIRDYFAWSIVNIFLGGFLLGFIAVYFSSQTRNRVEMGDLNGAKNFSVLTLICNLMITFSFFTVLTVLIVYFVYFMSYLDT